MGNMKNEIAQSKPAKPMVLPYQVVALVLQGGGALGSYQAGVYEGLAEAGIAPNWVAGISIGALNTAIIAGNPPDKRVEQLHAFWDTICRPAYFQPTTEVIQTYVERMGGKVRESFNAFEAWRSVIEGQKGFFVPRFPPAYAAANQSTGAASYYDTSPLKNTLLQFADFDRINSGEVRVSVGAVNVRSGNFTYFDTTRERLQPEHFMASGALPPAFPAIEIDGEYYWDGGLLSNTPLERVLSAQPQLDTLAFQVDLWSAKGHLPENIFDVQERQKDIQYSSRTRLMTDQMEAKQRYRRILRELLEHVPAAVRERDPWCRQAEQDACNTRCNVIHLIYRDKTYEGMSKDYEFSPLTMREHWASGLDDMRRTLAHPHWLDLPPDGKEFITHDVHRNAG